MLSFGHLGSERRFMTARVEKRAVDFREISFYRLKASLQAISHHSSERRFKTARMEKRAVDFSEISFKLLLAQIWNNWVLPSPIIKINKGDCF
jgi:hypothetical protein